MTPGEIVSIAFKAKADYAAITFADGLKEIRTCSLWQASEWAGAADLSIVLAAGDFFRWERATAQAADS